MQRHEPSALAATPDRAQTGIALVPGPTPELAATLGSSGELPQLPGPAEFGRGDLIGRYTILACLGQGGMGVVYAAYDPELDRKIAIKLLRDDTGTPEARSR